MGMFSRSYTAEDHANAALDEVRNMDRETLLGACLMGLGAMAAASLAAQVNYRFLLRTPTGLAVVAAAGAGAYYAYTQTNAPYAVQDSMEPVYDHPYVYGGAAAAGAAAVALLKQLGYHAHVHLNLL